MESVEVLFSQLPAVSGSVGNHGVETIDVLDTRPPPPALYI
jgi:hypothetical protein